MCDIHQLYGSKEADFWLGRPTEYVVHQLWGHKRLLRRPTECVVHHATIGTQTFSWKDPVHGTLTTHLQNKEKQMFS